MKQKNRLDVYLLKPRGFCAGVKRAITTVEEVLDVYGAPVYIYNEIVHNHQVVERLRKNGAVFIKSLEEGCPDRPLIFSAHGVSELVRKEALQKGFTVIDATCPLVVKVHKQVKGFYEKEMDILIIGHNGHPEVIGTQGQIPAQASYLVSSLKEAQQVLDVIDEKKQLGYVTQTTLSVDETQELTDFLKKKRPHIQTSSKGDICYATQNRQQAVKHAANFCDVLYVVGSAHSSNSCRLMEVGKKAGMDSFLIQSAKDVLPEHFDDKTVLGITAGASAPESLVKEVCQVIEKYCAVMYRDFEGIEEQVTFSLPKIS